MKTEFKYIAELKEEEFETQTVLPFTNEEGRPCVLIRNAIEKQNVLSGATDNLEYRLNTVVTHNEKRYFFHIVSCTKDDGYSKEQFSIAYTYLFKSIKEPKSDFEIGSLINSLEQLFKITPEKDRFKLHLGVYGELLFLNYMLEHGCSDIISSYHSNFFSKHDIEIDRLNRIEIKTTVGGKRIHHFSHDQIFRKDVNVYVVSNILEESEEGVSLNELFEKVISKIINAKALLWFGQLKGFCGISSSNPGPSFSYDKAISDLRVFNSKALPHLEVEVTKGISNISYDVDCATAEEENTDDFVAFINKLIEPKLE